MISQSRADVGDAQGVIVEPLAIEILLGADAFDLVAFPCIEHVGPGSLQQGRRMEGNRLRVSHLSLFEILHDGFGYPIENALRRAVHFVLSRDGAFLNSSSDARILPAILDAASEEIERPTEEALGADVARYAMEPLFIPGVSESI